jgi:hypothetical protein
MPTYTYENTQTGKQWNEILPIKDMKKPINKFIRLVITSPSLGFATYTKKREMDFRDGAKAIGLPFTDMTNDGVKERQRQAWLKKEENK